MTKVYIILLLIQIGVFVFFIMRGRKLAKARKAAAAAATGNTYEGLRSMALQVTPAQLKLGIPDSENLVYGVVMDWNMGDTLVTLVSFITGAASMYMSSGGGVIGSGTKPTVGEAASELVTLAQDYLGSAIPVTTFDIPEKGCVRFYLLTNQHKYAAQEQLSRFDDSTSAWLPLFEKANVVILEMRAGLN